MPKTKRLCTQGQKKFWGNLFRWSKRTIDLIQIVLHMRGVLLVVEMLGDRLAISDQTRRRSQCMIMSC
jgi:hypothetical protein